MRRVGHTSDLFHISRRARKYRAGRSAIIVVFGGSVVLAAESDRRLARGGAQIVMESPQCKRQLNVVGAKIDQRRRPSATPAAARDAA